MSTQVSVRDYLKNEKNILVIDGALATELEKQGCNLNDPLWSGKVLLEDPGLIEAVQLSYLRAGAQCIITASYQATPQGLMERKGLSEADAVDTVKRSVTLAQSARASFLANEEPPRPVYVAGSVGPYGAYLADGSEYGGRYALSEQAYRDFHRPRMAALAAAGVDLFAVETHPKSEEALAVVRLAADEFPATPLWVSVVTEVKADGTLRMGDGGDVAALVRELDKAANVIAVGTNCVSKDTATATLRLMHSLTSKPLLVYPNSGEVYDAATKTWSSSATAGGGSDWEHYWNTWKGLGVRLVGGCCRTGPQDIAELAALTRH